ncbi:MAG: hypothetical protein PHG04_01205 [Candidatus Nanoarchaeia archaeon]|nr:hypothetical protein [Candidatus Nanoarchaeia archaeon]
MGGKKSAEEIKKIIYELRDLKKFNIDEYKKRVRVLKKENPDIYFKAIITLNLDDSSAASAQSASRDIIKDEKEDLIAEKAKTPDADKKIVNEKSYELEKEEISKKKEDLKKVAAAKENQIDSSANDLRTKKEIEDSVFEKKTDADVVHERVKGQAEELKKQAIEKAKKIRKKLSVGFTITAVSIIGILLIAIVGLFLILNPPSGNASMNSLKLGYSLFNELDNVYLNYTFLYNSTGSDFLGKQYCSLKSSGMTCAIQTPQRSIVSKSFDNFLHYDLTGETEKISIDSLKIEKPLITSLYSEAYNLAVNFYVLESGREEVWRMGDYDCAPIFFEMNTSKPELSDLIKLRYEMCLNNDGIPIAIAKEKISRNSSEIIIIYLESIDSRIKDLSFANKTLAEWETTVIDNH